MDAPKAIAPIPGNLIPVSPTRPDQHPAAVYLARLGSGSRPTMRQALTLVADILSRGRATIETLPWAALRYQHTAAARAALLEHYQPATVNKCLAAIRGVLRECFRLGLMTAEYHLRASDLPSVKAQRLPSGRGLSKGELRALFAACAEDPTPAGARDAALLAVLYGAGLRRAEVVALDLSEYTPETGALVVRSGKGRKDRIGYASNGSRDALDAWIKVRGEDPGPLFLPIRKGGRHIEKRRMADQAIRDMVLKRAKEAKVQAFSPHDLRRSFISDMLDAGADISTVQQLVGHSSVVTTQRYDRRGEVTKRKAAELLHIPFIRV
jgi:integrase/recombinase XerD